MTKYDDDAAAIERAIVVGVMADELKPMTTDEIHHLALWLASEGIGKTWPWKTK